jgi:transcriptional regulator with AAA-type ATPase domain
MAAALMLLSVLLGGCAAELAKFQAGVAKVEQVYVMATTTTIPQTQAQIAVSSFQVLEAAATAYFKFCAQNRADSRCTADTLRTAIKYDRQGRQARDTIKAAARSGATIAATTYNLLIGAVNNLGTTPVATFGAGK